MKTLQKLTLLTAVAATMLAASPTESSAQSTSRDYVTRYNVSVKHPLGRGWMPNGTYTSRFQAERREQQLEREYWVIYHRGNQPKRFRSAPTRYEAHELMWTLKARGYCVSKERKFARVFRSYRRVIHTVRDYNPLTGRVRSTRTFNNYAQARSYYNKLRSQYWVIVKPTFGKKRYVFGGTKSQATVKAAALSLPLTQTAYPKRRTVRLTSRVLS